MGAISSDDRKSLEFINEDIGAKVYKGILQRNLLANFPELKGGLLIFQQDNAPVHRAKLITDYLNDEGLEKIRWPAESPDLNIMENIWAYIKRCLRDSYPNKNDLIEDIVRQWESIEDNYILALYESMGERLKAVTNSKGGPTKY